MHTQTPILLLLLLFVFLHQSSSSPTSYNVEDLGAKPDGRTDSTSAMARAWIEACASAKPSTIYIPKGRFFVKNLQFKGPCRNRAIAISIAGTLVASAGYDAAANWLLLEGVDGVSITGGTLDARGAALWACKNSGRRNCPRGATTVGITKSKNIKISGLTSLNSKMFHIVINGCQNVKLQGINLTAPENSPNTDGIHVQRSTAVAIKNSIIGTGDDCVSIGPGTFNLRIHNFACGPGHGISIGSLGKDMEEAGVENVRVENVILKNTQNGVRIKTWGRPSKGFVRNVFFGHVIMVSVHNPIIIDQNYCPNNKNCPGQVYFHLQVSGVKISDVTYRDIRGTSASEVAVKFECSEGNPCRKIKMEDVNLSYREEGARASCLNAAGSAAGRIEPSSCLY